MKTNYFNSLFFSVILLTMSIGHSQNILTDGDFSLTTDIVSYVNGQPPANVWSTWQGGDVNAIATVVDGVCNYQVINSGNQTYEVQLVQGGFTLEKGHSYQLSFDVKADSNRTFGVFLGENGGNWTTFIGYDRYTQNATTEWQNISLEFEAYAVFPYLKLSFELGAIDVNMYFDTVKLVDLGLKPHSVGIIGSSIGGWLNDIDMQTTDQINYTLSDYYFNEGIVKFRQDDLWDINWGNSSFPTGIGFQEGPNIPIPIAGNYNVTFNRESGEYAFECINNCPANIGILGTAVAPYFDWETDVNMSTNDGITYKLYSYTFSDGEVRFRQDDSSNVNWGNNDFPNGTGIQNGPNIPVTAGIYNVSFNIVTGDYSFTFPEIGILGSSLIGWNEDIDMQTTDGISYTLNDYYFNDGGVKFRQDNSWDINWGGDDFPMGWAYLNYYNNIPVQGGSYNVTFNIATGEYNFTATSCPIPGIKCPDNIYEINSPGICGAYINYPDIIPEYNCGGDNISITQIAGLPSGSLFPIGITTNTFELTNEEGDTATCSFDVMIFDVEPPIIFGLTDYFEPLWPANHKMVPIQINYNTSDNCGITTNEIYVYSNEMDNGLGDGNQEPDWTIIDEHNILLRAERSGNGNGREYYINIISRDESWNYSFQQVVVKVPHDNSSSNENTIKPDETFINPNKESPQFKIMAWPNPSTKSFNLIVDSFLNEPIDVFIANIRGRIISEFKIKNDMNSIHFGDDLQSGIYFVKVKQGEHSKTIQVVKE